MSSSPSTKVDDGRLPLYSLAMTTRSATHRDPHRSTERPLSQRELAISRALAAGATWAEIAQSLGCSPQAAHRRYRWLRHSEKTGAVWHERPLPL